MAERRFYYRADIRTDDRVRKVLATQLSLFEAEEGLPRPRTVRLARSRSVLHEPAVAEANARSAQLGCDLRSAFASFWAALPPERREQLRAVVAA